VEGQEADQESTGGQRVSPTVRQSDSPTVRRLASYTCTVCSYSFRSKMEVFPDFNANLTYSNGTSMISLIIPPKDQVSRVNKMLADEYGTASNIKSRVNRSVARYS
jgi:hypothetical protein